MSVKVSEGAMVSGSPEEVPAYQMFARAAWKAHAHGGGKGDCAGCENYGRVAITCKSFMARP